MHIIAGSAGVPSQSDTFETHMLNKRIQVVFPNIAGYIAQPNMRSVKLYKISVPLDCEGNLLDDLRPYLGGTGGNLKQRLFVARDLLIRLFGLEPVEKRPGNSVLSDGWRTAINVLILGKFREVKEEEKQ